MARGPRGKALLRGILVLGWCLQLLLASTLASAQQKPGAVVVQDAAASPEDNARLSEIIYGMLERRGFGRQAAPADAPRSAAELENLRRSLGVALLVRVEREASTGEMVTVQLRVFSEQGVPHEKFIEVPEQQLMRRVPEELSGLLPKDASALAAPAPPAGAQEPPVGGVAPPPAAGAGAYLGPSQSADSAGHDYGYEPPPEAESAWKPGPLIILRAGVMPFGSGTAKSRCNGAACVTTEEQEIDYDDKSLFGVGLEGMVAASPNFRGGLGLWYLPQAKIEADDEAELGMELSGAFILEGLYPASPNIGLTLRVQGGGALLFPQRDLQQQVDAVRDECDDKSQFPKCDVTGGPYYGWTFGGGPGISAAAGKVKFRFDFLFQGVTMSALSFERTNVAGQEENLEQSLLSLRFWLTLGVEFSVR